VSSIENFKHENCWKKVKGPKGWKIQGCRYIYDLSFIQMKRKENGKIMNWCKGKGKIGRMEGYISKP